MGGTCNTHWENEKSTKTSSENMKKTDDLGHLGVDGRIILK
jgi:hypothetical protein